MSKYMFLRSIYISLLADVRRIGRIPDLGVPDDSSFDAWVLIEGPLLDKSLLRYLETKAVYPLFPDWLKPLGEKALITESPLLIGLLRQTLVFCYKAELPPTHDQLTDAQKAFEETDAGCGIWGRHFRGNPDYIPAVCVARRIVGSVIYRIDWSEIAPSHGPGGVYPVTEPSEKSDFRTFYRSIHDKYPFDQNMLCIPSFWYDILVRCDGRLEMSESIVAKLTAVPKDSRGPRLISVHPKESIWIQQGQRKLLEARITSHPLTRGKINFTDQTVNGNLALSSSLSRELVTLDLKEASDRVSCELVEALFGPYAYSWLSCSRATHIKLLDGRIMELKKWAPMGNALCFPVESLVFFALVVAGIRIHYGEICNDVYVFGDDILYPRQFHKGVINTLVRFGLIPNSDKTFVNGFFRESCGVDAFKGVDITPLRAKVSDVGSLSNIESALDLALRARLRAFDDLSGTLYRIARCQLASRGIGLPITNDVNNSGFFEYKPLTFTEILLLSDRIKYRKDWQYWSERVLRLTGAQQCVSDGEWYHLQDSLMRLERPDYTPIASDRRGTEYAVPHRHRLERGWLTFSHEN